MISTLLIGYAINEPWDYHGKVHHESQLQMQRFVLWRVRARFVSIIASLYCCVARIQITLNMNML